MDGSGTANPPVKGAPSLFFGGQSFFKWYMSKLLESIVYGKLFNKQREFSAYSSRRYGPEGKMKSECNVTSK
jgi:hypothetical protein